jgi:hypothetical protein
MARLVDLPKSILKLLGKRAVAGGQTRNIHKFFGPILLEFCLHMIGKRIIGQDINSRHRQSFSR